MVIEELPPKKQGRPLLLGATLDSAIQQYILKLKERGCPVNTTIVRAAAKGIAKVMDIRIGLLILVALPRYL